MKVVGGSTRAARRFGLVLIAGVLAVGSVACTDEPGQPSGSGGSVRNGIPPQPNQTTGFVAELDRFARENPEYPNKMPWFCHAEGAGAHQHHASNGVVQGPETPTPAAYRNLVRGNLSPADCRQNAQSFDAALRYAQQYPTLRDATRAGFTRVVQYLPGMGTHHTRIAELLSFNASRPNTLQYAGDSPDAPLIGMSWLAPGIGGPPEGFAGRNDVWHQHRTLCYKGVVVAGEVIGNNVDAAQCRELGGQHMPLGLWMAHAWIVPNMQFQTDVHAGMHPCLVERGVAPANHSCWAMARHDHSMQSGGEGGDGHDHSH